MDINCSNAHTTRTAEKLAAARLPHIEFKHFLAGIDALDVLIELAGPQKELLFVNQAWEHAFGISFEQAQTQAPNLLQEEFHSPEYFKDLWRSVEETGGWQGPMTCRTPDGRQIKTITVITRFKSVDTLNMYLIVRYDLQKRSREEAIHVVASRMAALGRLAAGVAHEVNNPLTYAITNVQMIRGDVERLGDPELTEMLDEAENGLMRIADIVQKLKLFTQPTETIERITLVSEPLEAVLQLVHHDLRKRASLVQTLAPSLPPVLMSKGLLLQAFLNIMVNAIESIEPGSPSENQIEVTTHYEAGYVVITIRDTGRGILGDELEQVFDPFFSTRERKSMGLGLSITYAIIQEAGGRVLLESEEMRGTTVILWVPTKP